MSKIQKIEKFMKQVVNCIRDGQLDSDPDNTTELLGALLAIRSTNAIDATSFTLAVMNLAPHIATLDLNKFTSKDVAAAYVRFLSETLAKSLIKILVEHIVEDESGNKEKIEQLIDLIRRETIKHTKIAVSMVSDFYTADVNKLKDIKDKIVSINEVISEIDILDYNFKDLLFSFLITAQNKIISDRNESIDKLIEAIENHVIKWFKEEISDLDKYQYGHTKLLFDLLSFVTVFANLVDNTIVNANAIGLKAIKITPAMEGIITPGTNTLH